MNERTRNSPVDLLTSYFSLLTMWGTGFLIVIIIYEVFMRYVFGAATTWVNEMSLWMGGLIFFSSGIYAMQQRNHIRISIIYDIAPRSLRKLFDVASVCFTNLFVFAVIWGGFGEASRKLFTFERFGTAFDPPIPATMKSFILVVLLLMGLQSISNLIHDWPAPAIIRKCFDIAATIGTGIFVLWAIVQLFGYGEANMIPMHWRFAISLALASSFVIMVIALLRKPDATPDGVPRA